IKAGVTTVLGANTDVVRAVIGRVAAAQGAPLVYAPDGVDARASIKDGVTTLAMTTPTGAMPPIVLGLRGRHQIDNAITAVRALEVLDAAGQRPVPASSRQAALEHVRWPARLEMREWRANGAVFDVLIDGAHNPAGARALALYLQEAFARRLPIIFAAMQDKDIEGLVQAMAPSACAFICTAATSPRAARPEDLAARVRAIAPQRPVLVAATPAAALAAAAPLGRPIVVAGSLYLAGEIREVLS
ncbi:MAG: cyanophycin synthetase, partial [Acidobacteriota bacterium]